MTVQQLLPVCITGIGTVSPFGIGGRDTVIRLISHNETAIRPITSFSTQELSSHLGGEVLESLPIEDEEARRWSRVSQMAVTAARHAVSEARLSSEGVGPRLGLVIGTEFGDLRSTQEFHAGFLRRGPRGLRAFLFPNTVMNSIAGTVSIALGIKGPTLTLNQPGIAGEVAVARALGLLAADRADVVVVCGVDELFLTLYEALVLLNLPSPRGGHDEACRPLDRRHNGPVLGEGATAIVIERAEYAQAREAPILGQVQSASWGRLSARPHRYPSISALNSQIIDRTLQMASLAPDDIGAAYLSSCGDPLRDQAELALLSQSFGPDGLLVTTLAHLGGDYGSLGVLRVAAAAITASTGSLPQLHYLKTPLQPDLPYAVDKTLPASTSVLVHGIGRGGGEAALLISPPE